MSEVDGDEPLSGIVEVDETYIGGKRKGKRGRGAEGRSIVFSMMQKNDDVMTKIVDDVKRATLHPIIEANVEKQSEIQSDELHSYKELKQKGRTHNGVNHGAAQYVSKSGVTLNSIESFWARLKLSIKGTHIHVSKNHLAKYAAEFEYKLDSQDCHEEMLAGLLTKFVK